MRFNSEVLELTRAHFTYLVQLRCPHPPTLRIVAANS